MSILVAARGAGRSGFPVYMRTVSIYSNNYRKLHGMPMMRHVHLRKIEKQKINRLIEEWCKLGTPGPILSPNELRKALGISAERQKCYMGIDLTQGEDFSSCIEKEIIGRQIYGQKLINQNAVVKIVTNTAE